MEKTTKGLLQALSEEFPHAQFNEPEDPQYKKFLAQLFAEPKRPYIRGYWLAGKWYQIQAADDTETFVRGDDDRYYPA